MEKVSIIIPCKNINEQTEKCIQECLNLDYEYFEILVFPDFKDDKNLFKDPKNNVKIIGTGKVKPALKRNIGIKKAKGEYLAFIDDDAYPKKDWLKNAIKYFKDKRVGVVGGPNLTPPEANFAERVSGYVMANFLTSGIASIRYKIVKNQFVREHNSCNYISRKDISPEYDSNFLTAEDSKFCFDIRKKGYKILYANDVIVYHHRRDTLWKHTKQHFIYGRDIAWLTKKEFSIDKLYYSLLTIFVIGFILGLIGSFFSVFIKISFSIALLVYLVLIAITSLHNGPIMSFYVFLITIATHFSYGIGWFWGIVSNSEKTSKVKWTSR